MGTLPVFKVYTVDVRLRQFRKVTPGDDWPGIEFIEFDSPKGRRLLRQMYPWGVWCATRR